MPVSKRRKPKPKTKRRQMSFSEMARRSTYALDTLAPCDDAHGYAVENGWLAYVNMMNNPNEKDFITLLQVCNEVITLLNMGYGEQIDDIPKAQEGLMRCLERSRKHGSYAMDAELLPNLRSVIYTWEQQLKVTPVRAVYMARDLLSDMERRTPDGEVAIGEIQLTTTKIVKTRQGYRLA